MSIVALQVQIVAPCCPCSDACCSRSPLHELAERLRDEMRYGRDYHRRPITSPSVTVGLVVAFCD